MSTEYDESDCEEMQEDSTIPDQEMDVKRQEISLGKLFERKKDGTPKYFDSSKDRVCEGNTMTYRIPTHQRYGAEKWNDRDKERLVDSVFKGYPMQGLTASQQSGIVQGKSVMWKDIEDGGSRLTVLQQYYNDGFKYHTKLFSELEREYQNRFVQYTFNIDIMNEASKEAICEAFQRLNCGKPLRDEDKYYAMKDISPLVKLAIKLMGVQFWRADIMKTDSFGDKKRGILPEIIALSATLIFIPPNNTASYTTTSAIRLSDILLKPVPDGSEEKIQEFCTYYGRIIQGAESIEKIHNGQMSWHKTSKQLGLIMHDYLDKTSPHTLKQKEDMWVEIMQIARTVPDFMYGNQTIWNGLSKGARQSNSEKKSIAEKIDRIRKFYDPLTRKDLCLIEGIIYE